LATSSTLAFGQYLRTLRERRGLSLDDVATLSRTFADPVEKGYLSRCENGHQSLALSKMIALSRIYEVPAEVLVERLELDLEVEKLGGPETASKMAASTGPQRTAADSKVSAATFDAASSRGVRARSGASARWHGRCAASGTAASTAKT